MIRRVICKLPFKMKLFLCNGNAFFIYYPFSKIASIFEKVGCDVANIPLSTYRSYDFYMMGNDALDRVGRKLEKRYTRKEIQSMMETAGLEKVIFSEEELFWVALGYKK